MKAAMQAERHRSDGGGRAWIENEGDSTVRAATPGTWTIVYEVGSEGISEGGAIYLQVSPFWNWTTPQVLSAENLGYTLIETEDDDTLQLEARTIERQLLMISVGGRAMQPGEQVRIVYGEGIGAMSDSYAEEHSRFWIAVDGDGDGVRQILADSPGTRVLPGDAAMLVLTLPTIARPGETVRLCAAVLDRSANAGVEAVGSLEFIDAPAGFEPPEVSLDTSDAGRTTVEFTAPPEGTLRLRARLTLDGTTLEAESNPMLVSDGGPRVLWADLHGHTAESDGTGSPRDYFSYARDVAGLDIVALTDHDHWGLLFLDEHPSMWSAIDQQVRAFHEPGRFVALLGFEWTNWIYGHRHVVYFEDGGSLHSSMDDRYETPEGLWQALAGRDALTIAHHSAGGPVAIDWSIPPDPVLEPVTEIVSVHGSSEAADTPTRIYSAFPGNYVRDALARGYKLGFIGSGDTHDGHPGLGHLGAHNPTSGVAAVLCEDRTRSAVLDALRARRCYATTGERILLRFAAGGGRMGETVRLDELEAGPAGSVSVFAHVIGTAPIRFVDVVQDGEVIGKQPGAGSLEVTLTGAIESLQPGSYVYVRVIQEDGAAAWSSPVFFE